jgi:uncharacterized membrane protein YjfL (UPF0719 family)
MPLQPWLSVSENLIAAADGATGGGIDWTLFFKNVLNSIVFTVIGLVFFALAFWIIGKVAGFSVRKEIEEDQNTALAVVIGSIILGIAIIIAAAVHG